MKRINPLLLLLTAGLLSACGPEPYYIGVMMDPGGVDAAGLGVMEINFKDGVNDRPVRMRPFRLQPTTTEAEMLDTLRVWAADSSVAAAIVTSGHSSATTVSAALAEGGLPHLYATAEATPATADANRFALAPPADAEGRFMAEQAPLRADARVALIHADREYAHAMRAGLVARLAELGVPVTAEMTYPLQTDEAQLFALIAEVTETAPNIVYFIGDVDVLTVVLPRVRSEMPRTVVVSSSRAETRYLYSNPDGYYTGLRFPRFVNVRSGTPRMREYTFRNTSWTGNETTSRDAIIYDGMMVVAEALRTDSASEDGSRQRAAVRAYLASLGGARPPYDGVAGFTAFTLPGNAAPREWNFVEVAPSAVITSRDMEPEFLSEEIPLVEAPQTGGQPVP